MQCRSCGRENPEGSRFCQICGESLYRLRSLAEPEPTKKGISTGMALGIALIIVILGIAVIAGWLFIRAENSTPHVGKLTVTIENSYLYTDVNYNLLFDGQTVESDSVSAGYVLTVTYDITWYGGNNEVDVSLIWAGGSMTKTAVMVENSVTGVEFIID